MEKVKINERQNKNEVKYTAIIFVLMLISIMFMIMYFFSDREFSVLTLFILALPSSIMGVSKPLWKSIRENKFSLICAFVSLLPEVVYLADITFRLFK